MTSKKEADKISSEVIELIELLLYDDPPKGSAAERAIEALRKERFLTWEEFNRPSCPWQLDNLNDLA